MKTKICVNCRFCETIRWQYLYACNRNVTSTKEINPITGEITVKRSGIKYCEEEREDQNKCGNDAKYYKFSILNYLGSFHVLLR